MSRSNVAMTLGKRFEYRLAGTFWFLLPYAVIGGIFSLAIVLCFWAVR